MKKKLLATLLAITMAISVPASVSATWQKDTSGNWQWSENGVLQKGWKKVGGIWYYFDQNGNMKTGWVQDSGKWYYLNADGAMKTGWLQLGGIWYYLDGNGVMKTGAQTINGVTYNFNANGALVEQTQQTSALYKVVSQTSRLYNTQYSQKTWFEAIVEIENTSSSNIYLADARFDLENPNGTLLWTYDHVSKGPDVVAPGERAYFYCDTTVNDTITADTKYVFKPVLKVEKAKIDMVRFDISDISFAPSSSIGDFEITGRLKNNTNKEETIWWIEYALYDANGTLIKVGGNNIGMPKLAAGEQTSFRIPVDLPEGKTKDDIAKYRIYSEKFQMQF